MLNFQSAILAVAAAAVLAVGAGASFAQTVNDVPAVFDQYAQHCKAVFASPDAFYREALAGGPTSLVTVAATEDKSIHIVADMRRMPNIGSFITIGGFGGQTVVECDAEMYVDPTISTLDGNIAAFQGVMDTLPGVTVIGGRFDAEGIYLGDRLGPRETVATFSVTGWLGADQVATVAIQQRRYSISAQRTLPQPFTAGD